MCSKVADGTHESVDTSNFKRLAGYMQAMGLMKEARPARNKMPIL